MGFASGWLFLLIIVDLLRELREKIHRINFDRRLDGRKMKFAPIWEDFNEWLAERQGLSTVLGLALYVLAAWALVMVLVWISP